MMVWLLAGSVIMGQRLILSGTLAFSEMWSYTYLTGLP